MTERSHAEIALELPRLLERVSSRCETEFGCANVLALRPSFDKAVVAARLEKSVEALNLVLRGDLPVYANARDVRESVRNASKGSALPGVTLFRVSETLAAFARLKRWLASESERAPKLSQSAVGLPHLAPLTVEIEGSVSPEGEVLDAASPDLKAIRARKAAQSKRILDRLQSLINASRSYLQEPIYTQRSGRYVLPVKAAYKGKVPGIVHDSSGSGQTLFIEPAAVAEETNKLSAVEGEEREEVERILRSLSEKVGIHADEVLAGFEALADIDAALAIGKEAEASGGAVPRIVNDPLLRIESGHHPLLDREVSVPVDIGVGGAMRSLLITGPNTGGKTVCLKTLGLYPLMIGCGLLPPCRSLDYGVFSGVWADIGDEQSLEQSLSTFSGHLRNIARALTEAPPGALCLFDEIGAGTDPAEGAAIGKATLDALTQRGTVVAATTHYGELKEFAIESAAFRTAAMEFDSVSLRPTYRVILGATGASHAFEIARRYGLPDSVVSAAEERLGVAAVDQRKRSAALDALVKEAAVARDEAEGLKKSLSEELRAINEDRAKLRARMESARESAREAIAEAVREMREKYRELLERTAAAPGIEREQVLQDARSLERDFLDAAEVLEDEKPQAGARVGDTVRVKGRPQTGTVLEVLKHGGLVAQIGSLKVTLRPEDIEIAEAESTQAKRPARRHGVAAASTISSELMLRRLRVEEAQDALEQYFDDASLAGLTRARIVHGKGDGVLRKVVRDFLSGRHEVSNYYEAPPDAGGSGVTIVEFKT